MSDIPTHCLKIEGLDSPTWRFTAETSPLKWSLSLWLLSKTSITLPFSSSSLLLLPTPSPGRGFCAFIVFYHTEFFTKASPPPALLLARRHTPLTFSRKCSHSHSLTLCHLSSFVSHSSFFLCPSSLFYFLLSVLLFGWHRRALFVPLPCCSHPKLNLFAPFSPNLISSLLHLLSFYLLSHIDLLWLEWKLVGLNRVTHFTISILFAWPLSRPPTRAVAFGHHWEWPGSVQELWCHVKAKASVVTQLLLHTVDEVQRHRSPLKSPLKCSPLQICSADAASHMRTIPTLNELHRCVLHISELFIWYIYFITLCVCVLTHPMEF